MKKLDKEKLYFTKVTELFFRELSSFSRNNMHNIKPINLFKKSISDYNACYNSFQVKEAPDFLFGIWWSEETKIESSYNYETKKSKKEKVDYIKGSFFGDYLNEVDKFKPWRCYFNVYFEVEKKKINLALEHKCKDYAFRNCDSFYDEDPLLDILQKIDFVIREPELAFCTCWNSWDYNLEYHSKEEAKEEYRRYIEYKDYKYQEKVASIKEQFSYFKKLMDSKNLVQGSDYLVKDLNLNSGFNTSPRFEIYFNIGKDSQQYLEKPNKYGYMGTYAIGDIIGADDAEAKTMHNDFWNFRKELGEKFRLVFSDDFDFFCVATTPKRFACIKRLKSIMDLDRPDLVQIDKRFDI